MIVPGSRIRLRPRCSVISFNCLANPVGVTSLPNQSVCQALKSPRRICSCSAFSSRALLIRLRVLLPEQTSSAAIGGAIYAL